MATDRLVELLTIARVRLWSARTHFSTLDSARHRSGDAWIQPVDLKQSSSVRGPFDCYIKKALCRSCGTGLLSGRLGLVVFHSS